MSYQHGQAPFFVPMPTSQDPPSQEEDSNKQKTLEGNFFGGIPSNAPVYDKTIKITPLPVAVPSVAINPPIPTNNTPIPSHNWFENTPISQSEASSAFDSITMPTRSASSVEASNNYHHPPSSSFNIPYEHSQRIEPLNDFGDNSKDLSLSSGNFIAQSADLTEVSYIGDETFERLSTVSLSTSQGPLAFDNNMHTSFTATSHCPRCHKVNEVSSSFCGRCGMQLFSTSPFSHVPPAPNNLHVEPTHQEPISISHNIPPQPSQPSQTPVPLPTVDSLSAPFSQLRMQPSRTSITSAQESINQNFTPMHHPQHTSGASSGFTPFVPFSAAPVGHQQPPRTSLFGLKSQSQQTLSVPNYIQNKIEEPEPTIVVPTKPTRAHPAFCFGFGGQLIVTFPLKQVRFHIEQTHSTSKSPHNQYRPGAIYQVPLISIPEIRNKLLGPSLMLFGTNPINTKFLKVDELKGTLGKWIDENAGDSMRLLASLFALLLDCKEGFSSIGHDSWLRLLSEGGQMNLSFPDPIQSPTFSAQSTHGVTYEMSRLILNGDRTNAVLLAVTNQRWAEALLLSSFVDGGTYYSTVSEFTRKTYPLGHPLRLVFLLLAGQCELAGYELHQMGPTIIESWRAILAMILGNRCQNDYLAISSLGDALLNQGEVIAAHLCHILSDDASLLGSASDPNTRVTLVGLDHRNVTSFWRSLVNIRLTEIFEFCLGVANQADESFFLPHLLPFKYIYITYLCDLGFLHEASDYLNIIEPQLAMLKNTLMLEKCQELRSRIGSFEGKVSTETSSKQGGWLPKVGGLIERVIGVNETATAATSSAQPPNPQIPNPLMVAPLTTGSQTSPRSFESESCEVVDRRWAPVPMEGHISGSSSVMMQHNPSEANSAYRPIESQSIPNYNNPPAGSTIPQTDFSNPSYSMPPTMPPLPMMQALPVETPQIPNSMEKTSPQYYSNFQTPSSQPHYQTETTNYPADLQHDNSRNISNLPNVPTFVPVTQSQQQFSMSPSNQQQMYNQGGFPHNYPPAIGTPPLQTGIHSPPTIEEDDFGFGNNPKSLYKQEDSSEISAKVAQDSGDGDAKGNQEKKGVLGVITGLFWKKNSSTNEQIGSPKQANLGEPNTFRYDEKLKRWVDSKDPSTAQPISPPPPPPSSVGPNPAMMPQVPATPMDPNSFRRGVTRSARSRYVDPLNPNASIEESQVPMTSVPFINPPMNN